MEKEIRTADSDYRDFVTGLTALSALYGIVIEGGVLRFDLCPEDEDSLYRAYVAIGDKGQHKIEWEPRILDGEHSNWGFKEVG